MKKLEEAELPDYGERKGTPAFIPATELPLKGPPFLDGPSGVSAEAPKKAPVIDITSRDHAATAKQKRRAA